MSSKFKIINEIPKEERGGGGEFAYKLPEDQYFFYLFIWSREVGERISQSQAY